MQVFGCRWIGRFFLLTMAPLVALSMGGCPQPVPPDDGGGDTPTCGDGAVDTGEQCDDGNTVSGDGCSAACQTEEPPPPAPSDSDGDGVRDDLDQCPETPRGTQVDANGCPADAPPPVDADGDTVPDGSDQCPNSPAGAEVDADGCAANQRDTDGDGLTDNLDACAQTPAHVQVDNRGCPVSAPGTPDTDGDGVPDDIDQCPNTTAAAQVDANGCSASQRDSDADGVKDNNDQCPGTPAGATVDANGCPTGGGGGSTPVCGNGTVETGEQCDDGNTTSGDGCSSTCQTEAGGPRCGNGALETGEQCDDGNTTAGDGCSATCQFEGSGLANDLCARPTPVGEGTTTFTNVGATTDGPDQPADCLFFGRSDIPSDVWFCYTATCTGTAAVSLCGSGYDTKLAVYSGCGCPTARPAACSDDDCGTGVENTQSRVTVNVTAGQTYMVRIGGYDSDQGEGRLTISCGQTDICTTATGDCMTSRGENQPGCGTPTCCNSVCAVDRFCCDVTWDSFCASEASGLCTTGFPACNTRAGACTGAQAAPGCNNVECCNAVCQTDPFCCITAWDQSCADRSNLICTACGRAGADCFTAHADPGCNSISCCGKVCADDNFCCNTEWDATCAQTAATMCR